VLPVHLDFRPERDADLFAAVPAAPAVFLLRSSDPQAEPYVSKTANLRRRLIRLLGETEARTRKLNLRDRVASIEYAPTGSDFESGFVLYQTLRSVFPATYQDRLRLRPAPLARFRLENRYPRVSITTHLGSAKSVYYGPFPSRAAAEKFANDALDFFKIRRCIEELNPDPAFPGCVYSEMKMCLAPCFKGCTDEQYAAEVARVETFFDSRGLSLVREISAARDRASSGLEFETAAAMHVQLEKLKPVVSQLPEIVHRLDRLAGLMIQPSSQPDSVTFFRIHSGCLSDPITFPINQHDEVVGPGASPGRPSTSPPNSGAAGAQSGSPARADFARDGVSHVRGKKTPHSMESRVSEALSAAQAPSCSRQETAEHLAILKRWYYRSSKLGEIFLAEENGELPMRRIVRGISRVFRGEKPAADLNETAREYWINRGREAELGKD
jgi:excinuclease ABC subunit C